MARRAATQSDSESAVPARPRRSRWRGIGAVLAVFLLLILAVGFWQDWFDFSMHKEAEPGAVDRAAAEEQLDLTFSVKQDKISQDLQQLQKGTTKLVQQATTAAELESLEGRIKSIDAKRLTIETGSRTVTFDLEGAEIVQDRATDSSSLRVGDQVIVTFLPGKKIPDARKITRVPPDQQASPQ